MAPRVSKSLLQQQQYFVEATGATKAVAQQYLQAHGNVLERAINAYLDEAKNQQGAGALGKQSSQALIALFDRYVDPDEDLVTTDGALAMFEDLGIAPDSVAVLPLSYCLDAPSLGRFHREKYVAGWQKLLGSVKETPEEILAQQREAIPQLLDAFKQDKALFGKSLYKSVYEYAFLFARNEGQKSLPLDVALMLWDMLLPHSPSFSSAERQATFSQADFDSWKRFLTEASGAKVITRDTWLQFLEFTREQDAIANHDFNAAWPSLIDDFVAWARQNTQ
ncbi:Scaffold-type E3 ligase [Malassezia cuniculi]|uniref:Defective in cullin neddylation protein n=1 Tax=Malassezia cuniculi TaxID=948313 RepID=A0AAF0ESR7_9BASI|nr:Scaffold-type E3 ligase [Malassezia cuniculi]